MSPTPGATQRRRSVDSLAGTRAVGFTTTGPLRGELAFARESGTIRAANPTSPPRFTPRELPGRSGSSMRFR